MEALLFFLWFVLAIAIGAWGSSKTAGFWGAFFASLILSPLIGAIIVASSKKRVEKVHRYKKPLEMAKLALYKGNKAEAIDQYLNALYYLENDYNNSYEKNSDKKLRSEIIEKIKNKIEKLRNS